MSDKQNKLKEIQEELKWITLQENPTFKEKLFSRGLTNALVPVGCLVTTGILISGLYNMYKRDSKKQQLLMRYRVLAQGITVVLASIGILKMKFSS